MARTESSRARIDTIACDGGGLAGICRGGGTMTLGDSPQQRQGPPAQESERETASSVGLMEVAASSNE